MRQLFHRPDHGNEESRFASADDFFSVVTRNADMNNDDDNIPKGWIDGYKHVGSSQEREATIEQIVHAQMMKYCLKKFQISDTCKDVLKLLKKSVPAGTEDCREATRFFEKFRSEQDVRELIRLYTLETPLYTELQQNVDSFAIELYSRLSALEERAFKGGTTYRGARMTDDDIKAYRWAENDKGRMIEIKKMTSTSLKEDMAIHFATKYPAGDKHYVLCVLEFPDVCYTAIDLNMDKPITKYPHEEEILLLPGTLFEVQEVTNGPKSGWYTIRLKNVPVSYKILKKTLSELRNP